MWTRLRKIIIPLALLLVASVSALAAPLPCPCSIWPGTAVPALIDQGPDSSVELGVTFRADSNGYITGIRFYKSTGNTGTHVGNLWSATGTLLATATFTGESSSGWQQVNLSNPVAITANTTYVASYHTNVGHYSVTENYFATSGADNSPLHAPANGSGSLNGPYAYGNTSAFPKSTYKSTNYWVDVVFNTTVNSSPVAPAITTQPISQTVTAGQTATFSASTTGTAPLAYQWRKNGVNISGAASSSYTTPVNTTADSGAQFSVVVSNSAGSATSSAATLTVNAAAMAPTITTQPISQTVTVGQTATFSVSAAGTAPLAYQWRKNGVNISGATSSSYTTPAITTADSGAQFSVVVSNSAGSVTSNSATLTVSASTRLLSATPTSLSFGNIAVGTSGLLTTTLTNTGNSNVTISNVSMTGAGFNAGGISGQILAPGQKTTLHVTFLPALAGSVTGSAVITSNAGNSPATISLSGLGVQLVSHSVTLFWTASTSTVAGYNVYSGTLSGGPYTKLTTTPIAATTYLDSNVQTGTHYFVTTAVTAAGAESAYSNQASAVIP